ncbi:MAG: ABC transporter ATP-binding protein [Nitrospiria bacterium]
MNATPGTVIELAGVTKRYHPDHAPAVDALSLTVAHGHTLAVLGPSGCGKTTLLRLIAGFEEPSTGMIRLDGNCVAGGGFWIPPEQRGVGMVFQDYALFPHLTVEQNVVFGLHKRDRPGRRRRVADVLDLVGLTGFERRYPHQLSGGQQQRVALARALAPNPIVVLLDEPFSNLDPDMRSRMRAEVAAILQQSGATTVLVTHDHEEAFAMADQIAVLNQGRLEQIGTPEVIYHVPTTPFVAEFVGQADFIPGTVEGDRVRTELGPFPNTAGLPSGTDVSVMIRPDDVLVIGGAEGAATILSRQFRGSENLYTVLLPSGRPLHSTQPSDVVYARGSRVDIKISATHTVLFQAAALAARKESA